MRARHDELLSAINSSNAVLPQRPLVKRYQLLAANGVDIVANCYGCGRSMRFLPEYAGQATKCLHCQQPVSLALEQDIKGGRCIACGKDFACLPDLIDEEYEIYDDPPKFCGPCGQRFALGVCPYCNQQFYMDHRLVWSDKPTCPICSKKLRLADTPLNQTPIDLSGIPSNGTFRHFEKRGLFF